tara:strand:- start:39 stop:317 length:279 start_codon:yes stop_codon:yes gene_type:complete
MKEPKRYNCGNGEGLFADTDGWYITHEEHQEIVNELKEQLRIGIVSGRFNSDNNEENEKALTAILYEHTDEKEMKIREVDYEEVVKDIMEYF